MAKQPRENPKHMTKIGGQALIEGVMMKGADTGAMACRLPNGEIDVETWAENNGKNMPWYRKCPFVRGSFNFVLSMKDGYRCLTKSAEKQVPEDGEDDTEEMNRFEKWLDEKLGDKLFGIIMTIGMIVGIAVAIGLFPAEIPHRTADLPHCHFRQQPLCAVAAGGHYQDRDLFGVHGVYRSDERYSPYL